MNRYFNILILALALLMGASSCKSVHLEEDQPSGYLIVNLQNDIIQTKAIEVPEEDMIFSIKVYKGTEEVASVEDHTTITEPIVLQTGTYKVVASYGDPEGAGFDSPCYQGETSVKILADKTTTADVICKLKNVKVTVELDQQILDNFSSYNVSVYSDQDKKLTFTGENLSQTGYVSATPGTLTWEITLVNLSGTTYTNTNTYEEVKAGDHYSLRFSLGENTGDGHGAIKVLVDCTVVESDVDLELDFSEKVQPSFSTNPEFELLDGAATMILNDATPKRITFDIPEGLKSLVLVLDDFSEGALHPFKWFELIGITEEELAGVPDGIDIVQHPALGGTSAEFEISGYLVDKEVNDYTVNLIAYDRYGQVADCSMLISVISDVDADMVSATPWAKFAVVKGKWFAKEQPSGLTFQYKSATDISFQELPLSAVTYDVATKTFTADIGNLQPETNYVVRAVSAKDKETREVEFRTKKAENLYNMGFDDWFKDGKVWRPYAEGASVPTWDSANDATASFAESKTVPETSHVISGTAVKMQSDYLVIAFAAGNLYTGKFGHVNGKGASLDWGTPFSSRPVALKGHYDYIPKAIDRAAGEYSHMMGTMDKCQIMCILTDWDQMFNINTTAGQFVDLENDEHIIALGKYESDVQTNGYVEFTIPLTYRNDRTPKYIVVVACSSYLGDYFTGGVGSTLYVDEFSFEYDVTKLTDAQKAQVNYK